MAKHTQTIRRQFADDCFSMFDHFVGLALKRLKHIIKIFPRIVLWCISGVKRRWILDKTSLSFENQKKDVT